jgi:hypothetical protein
VIVTNGQLPYPFGLDKSGYQVTSLAATLAKAKVAGATVLWGPYDSPALDSAIVEFPGGYIAEIHLASQTVSEPMTAPMPADGIRPAADSAQVSASLLYATRRSSPAIPRFRQPAPWRSGTVCSRQ